AAATHKVIALRTLVFPGPSSKLSPIEALPLGAWLAIARSEGSFAVTAGGGYLPARHLAPIGMNETDFVAVAERFVGTPYLWGGKTSFGLDCSGLVRLSLNAAGIVCPRDSVMQQGALRTLPDPTQAKGRRRRRPRCAGRRIAMQRGAARV